MLCRVVVLSVHLESFLGVRVRLEQSTPCSALCILVLFDGTHLVYLFFSLFLCRR